MTTRRGPKGIVGGSAQPLLPECSSDFIQSCHGLISHTEIVGPKT